jgi:hypothetical protein
MQHPCKEPLYELDETIKISNPSHFDGDEMNMHIDNNNNSETINKTILDHLEKQDPVTLVEKKIKNPVHLTKEEIKALSVYEVIDDLFISEEFEKLSIDFLTAILKFRDENNANVYKEDALKEFIKTTHDIKYYIIKKFTDKQHNILLDDGKINIKPDASDFDQKKEIDEVNVILLMLDKVKLDSTNNKKNEDLISKIKNELKNYCKLETDTDFKSWNPKTIQTDFAFKYSFLMKHINFLIIEELNFVKDEIYSFSKAENSSGGLKEIDFTNCHFKLLSEKDIMDRYSGNNSTDYEPPIIYKNYITSYSVSYLVELKNIIYNLFSAILILITEHKDNSLESYVEKLSMYIDFINRLLIRSDFIFSKSNQIDKRILYQREIMKSNLIDKFNELEERWNDFKNDKQVKKQHKLSFIHISYFDPLEINTKKLSSLNLNDSSQMSKFCNMLPKFICCMRTEDHDNIMKQSVDDKNKEIEHYPAIFPGFSNKITSPKWLFLAHDDPIIIVKLSDKSFLLIDPVNWKFLKTLRDYENYFSICFNN